MGINAVKASKSAPASPVSRERAASTATNDATGAFSATMPAACSAASPAGRTWSSVWRSSRLRASGCRAARSTAGGEATLVETHGRHDPCVGIRDADCRGDAGAGADRSGPAPSRVCAGYCCTTPMPFPVARRGDGARGNGYNRAIRWRMGGPGSARGDDHAS